MKAMTGVAGVKAMIGGRGEGFMYCLYWFVLQVLGKQPAFLSSRRDLLPHSQVAAAVS